MVSVSLTSKMKHTEYIISFFETLEHYWNASYTPMSKRNKNLEKYHPIELSAMTEIVCICAVQNVRHKPHVVFEHLKSN